MAPSIDRFIGVDFSGARDAGVHTWLATVVVRDGRLALEGCDPIEALPGGAREREPALAALRTHLGALGPSVVGLDFPFGLPRALVAERSWTSFLRGFAERYEDAEAFRESCQQTARPGRDLKRETDVATRTPFSPYNLRIYRQTFHGIRDVLAPLVLARTAVAPPMQKTRPTVPWLIEACPASYLKRVGRYRPYKGGHPGHGRTRRSILEAAMREDGVEVDAPVIARIVADAGGDALDATLAALIAARSADTLATLECTPAERVEARVFC